MATATQRRCKGTNKRGEPCQATVVNADGLCSAHSGKQDMRELGRKGGKGRRRGIGEQLPEGERLSLRQFLRDGLDHATIKAAIERSLAGGNESARVACVKFLSDLELYRRDGDECPRCAQFKAEAPAASAKLMQLLERQITRAVQDADLGRDSVEGEAPVTKMIRRAVQRARDGREEELQALVVQALEKVLEHLQHAGTVVENDINFEQAAKVLAQLEEHGLLVRGSKVDELVEEKAQQRLEALKQEHGLPV